MHDFAAKVVFAEKSNSALWVSKHGLYLHVAVSALALLVAFPFTCLCKSAFLSMVVIKTKLRNGLVNHEFDLRFFKRGIVFQSSGPKNCKSHMNLYKSRGAFFVCF